MILHPKRRIFDAAAKEPGRYTMHGVHVALDASGKPILSATDGHLLVQIQAELEDGEDLAEALLVPVILSAADLKDGWKGNSKQPRFLRYAGGRWMLFNGASSRSIEVIDGEFPRVSQIVPEHITGRSMKLNVDYILAIACATGAESLSFQVPEFKPKNGASNQVMSPVRIVVDGDDADKDAVAVIMPITVK